MPVDRGYNLQVFDDNPWISRTLAGITRLQPTKSKRKSTPLTIDLLHHIVRKPTGLQPPILIDNLSNKNERSVNGDIKKEYSYLNYGRIERIQAMILEAGQYSIINPRVFLLST